MLTDTSYVKIKHFCDKNNRNAMGFVFWATGESCYQRPVNSTMTLVDSATAPRWFDNIMIYAIIQP